MACGDRYQTVETGTPATVLHRFSGRHWGLVMTKRILVTVGIALLAMREVGVAQQPAEETVGTPRPLSTVVEPAGAPAAAWIDCMPPANAGGPFWVRGEGVVGWMSGVDLPPLVTTSTPNTPKTSAGI